MTIYLSSVTHSKLRLVRVEPVGETYYLWGAFELRMWQRPHDTAAVYLSTRKLSRSVLPARSSAANLPRLRMCVVCDVRVHLCVMGAKLVT